MKKFNLSKFAVSLTATGAVALGCILTAGSPFSSQALAAPAKPDSKTAKKTVYVCTMHPDVVSAKPGKCPKCKMTLVKKSVTTVYTCSMHPEVRSLKPGPCPKCKMPMTKMK